MTSISLILGGVSCAFCQHRRAPRGRADGSFAPTTETHSLKIRLPAPQSVAVFPTSGNVIRAFLPWRGRLAARTFEALRTRLCAQALAASFSLHKGPLRLILNLVRPQSAGSSLCVAFIDHCREPFDRIANWFVVSPILSSVAINHAHKKAWRRSHDVQRNPVKGA